VADVTERLWAPREDVVGVRMELTLSGVPELDCSISSENAPSRKARSDEEQELGDSHCED
jgi:hypothetical protein